MAMRSANVVVSGSILRRFTPRFFSVDGGKGKAGVLDEKERAQETIFIQKMERERLQKQRTQMNKEDAEKGKEASDKYQKSKDETQKD